MDKIIASDLHLGYENARYDKILNLFDIVENKSDVFILPGDTFDLWRYPISKMEREKKLDLKLCVNRLFELSLKIPVDIIPGNHDFQLEKYWKYDKNKYKNLQITDSLFIDNIYYTHGWQFDVEQRFGSFTYSWLIKTFPYIYQKFFRKPSEILIKDDEPHKLSINVHKKAQKFAENNNLKYIVMGHTHIPSISDKIIDCGDFVDSCSYITLKNNNKPKLNFI